MQHEMKFAAVRSTIWKYSLALFPPFSVKRNHSWKQNRCGVGEPGIVQARGQPQTRQPGAAQRTLSRAPAGRPACCLLSAGPGAGHPTLWA